MVTDRQETENYERYMFLETGYGFPEGGQAVNKTWRLYLVCTDDVCHAHGT